MSKNNWIVFIIFAVISFSLMAFVYVMKVNGDEEFTIYDIVFEGDEEIKVPMASSTTLIGVYSSPDKADWDKDEDPVIPAGSLITLNYDPKPKSKRIWILAGFIGGIILYTLGFLTGFRFCHISWKERDDERQRKEDEYNDGVAKRIREMGEVEE